MQDWEEHQENHDRFLKSCLDGQGTRHAATHKEAQPAEVTFEPGEISAQPVAVPS